MRRETDDTNIPLPGHATPPPTPPLTNTPTDEARQHSDVIEVGTRDGQPVRLALGDWPHLAIEGGAAEDVIRAWLATLLATRGPYAVDVLTTDDLADQLLANLAFPSIRKCQDDEQVLRCLETEVVGRTRRLEDADAEDAAGYRLRHPEDPLPLLITVTLPWSAELSARWGGATTTGRRLGCAALCIGASGDERQAGEAQSDAHLVIDPAGFVTEASPPNLAETLQGARLYQLMMTDVTDLLAPVAAVHDETLPGSDGQGPTLGIGADPRTSTSIDEPTAIPTAATAWTEPMRTTDAELAIHVRVLGPAQVDAWGRTINSGLRASAYELLAWYLLRPEGATAEAAIDSIWPNETADKGRDRFWTALGNLRSRLRGPDGRSVEVLSKSGDHYRPDPDTLDADLWYFQSALARAANANDPAEKIEALIEATTAYQGDLCPGADYLWIEPVREDLHRRALDAHLRLAELRVDAGEVDAAIALVERALELDAVCEEAYRRLMELQARQDRLDAVKRTWRQLQGRLADLDLDPEPQSSALYTRLTADQRTPVARSRR